jgi:hypothetical protein
MSGTITIADLQPVTALSNGDLLPIQQISDGVVRNIAIVKSGSGANGLVATDALGNISLQSVIPQGSSTPFTLASLTAGIGSVVTSQPAAKVFASPAGAGGLGAFITLAAPHLSGAIDGVSIVNNGTAITLGNASAGTVLPLYTGAISRSLSSFRSDALNLKDFGAVMDGVTDDSNAWASALSNTPSRGILNIPKGGYKVNNFPALSAPGYSVILNRLGTLDNGTSAAGTNPTGALGDGFLNIAALNGYLVYEKNIITSTNGYTTIAVNLNNASTSAQFGSTTVVGNLTLNASSQPGASGNTRNLNLITNSGASNNNQDVGLQSTVYQTGNTDAFAEYISFINQTGLIPTSGGGQSVAAEFDMKTNGPDGATNATLANPISGARCFLHFSSDNYNPPSWVPNQTHAVGDCIYNGLYTYVYTVAGVSGSSPPAFPTSAGSVTDGTATLTFGTTLISQISRVIQISTKPGTSASIATALIVAGNVDSAAIDLSQAVPTSSMTAGLRFPAGLGIDFSGNTTFVGLNLRTLSYNATDTALEYVVSGAKAFAITDVLGLNVGPGTPLASNATGGFLKIPIVLTAPTGTPASGGADQVYNTGTHSLNIYDHAAGNWYHVVMTSGAN